MASKSITEQVLRLLIKKAQNRETVTYEEIAVQLGLPSSGNALGSTLSPILGDIYDWAVRRGQPPLTSLVVRKSGEDKGLPGRGFWSLVAPGSMLTQPMKRASLNLFQAQVFNYYDLS